MDAPDDRPLSGITVLDLTSVVVGPAATLRLAELGADIIKLETPSGDLLRTLGGPSPSGTMSGKFMHFNRGKRFLCLDLKNAEGLAALKRVLSRCDAFVSNIRPDALARMQLDANACHADRPNLVHCVITGFGPGGPYRGRPAYDTVLQAVSGLAGLTLPRDGRPSFAPFLAVDHVVGEIVAGALSAALVRRFRTGRGSALEIPMFETMAAFVLKEHMGAATFDPPLGPAGDRRVLDPKARPVRTQDGWIAITANTDVQAQAFLKAVGRGDLIQDARFASVSARVANSGDWFALREEALAQGTTAHWMEVFTAADIPAMPCHSLDTLRHDPHLSAVGLVADTEHPTEGPASALRPSIIIDGRTQPVETPPHHRGADTRAILSEAGYDDDAIDGLVHCGAAILPAGTTTT